MVVEIDQGQLTRYVRFVQERHRAYESRLAGDPGPWCEDPIVRRKKFTNVFRVLDYGSQFVVRNLVGGTDLSLEDILIRCILYRTTNRVDAWGYHKELLGGYPTAGSVLSGDTDEVWGYRKAEGLPLMNFKAYIPGKADKGIPQWQGAIHSCQSILETGEPFTVESFMESDPSRRMTLLTRLRGFSWFMAQQVFTDFHYSPYGAALDTENSIVVEGPGSKRGAAVLTGTSRNTKDAIYYLRDMWAAQDEPPLIHPGGTPRPPSLMDVQNTLCEFSKYRRYAERPLPPGVFTPKHNPQHEPPVFPEHWTEYR